VKSGFLGVVSILFSFTVSAQSIDMPKVNAGDTWTYLVTTEKGSSGWSQTRSEVTVARVTDSGIYFTSKQSGSTQPAVEMISGADWARVRDVNGKQTVVNRPLNFPLRPGKKWEVSYTEQHPNKIHRSEQLDANYAVVGNETVEVPAGKFTAIKIEVEGRWTAELEPSTSVVQAAQSQQNNATVVSQVNKTDARSASGRIYKAFWYVPEVKRWVKSVEEYYGSNGVRNERYTNELESFKTSD